MSEGTPTRPLAALHEALRSGSITRREFTLRALALGVAMPVISFVLRAETVRGAVADGSTVRHAGWGVAAQAAAGRPTAGMDGRKRGEGGELKLIQWQAPSMLSPHVSTGTKDYLAAELIIEPLMYYLPDGTIIPNLVTEVPTVRPGAACAHCTAVRMPSREVTPPGAQPLVYPRSNACLTSSRCSAQDRSKVLSKTNP